MALAAATGDDSTRIVGPRPAAFKRLTAQQRADYERDGVLAVEGLVDVSWLERLRAVVDEFVDKSRALTESNAIFDLDRDHSAEAPRLRRLSCA